MYSWVSSACCEWRRRNGQWRLRSVSVCERTWITYECLNNIVHHWLGLIELYESMVVVLGYWLYTINSSLYVNINVFSADEIHPSADPSPVLKNSTYLIYVTLFGRWIVSLHLAKVKRYISSQRPAFRRVDCSCPYHRTNSWYRGNCDKRCGAIVIALPLSGYIAQTPQHHLNAKNRCRSKCRSKNLKNLTSSRMSMYTFKKIYFLL